MNIFSRLTPVSALLVGAMWAAAAVGQETADSAVLAADAERSYKQQKILRVKQAALVEAGLPLDERESAAPTALEAQPDMERVPVAVGTTYALLSSEVAALRAEILRKLAKKSKGETDLPALIEIDITLAEDGQRVKATVDRLEPSSSYDTLVKSTVEGRSFAPLPIGTHAISLRTTVETGTPR